MREETRANLGKSLSKALLLLSMTSVVEGLHYYAQKDRWICFKDTLATNYTLEMEVIVHD